MRTASGNEQVLTPETARQVTIEEYDTYVSRRFTRLINPYTGLTDYRNYMPQDSLEEIHGFLLYLTQGNGVRLYKFQDKKRENYFIEKDGGPLTELKFKVHVDDNNKVVEDLRFKQQLQTAFALNPATNAFLYNKLQRLEYKEDKLEAFIGQTAGKQKKKRMYPADLVVMGGLAYNTFDIIAYNSPNTSSQGTFKPGVAPVLGVTYFDYSQRNFARNFILLQAKWYHFRHSAIYEYPNSGRETTLTYESQVANLNVGLGRNLIKTPTLSYYAAVAPSLVVLLGSKETNSFTGAASKSTLLTYNFTLQTGVRLKRNLGVWLHYNVVANDVQSYVFYDHRHRTVQLGLDWLIKKQKTAARKSP